MQARFAHFTEKLRERTYTAHAHTDVVKWAGLGQQRALGETLAGKQPPLKGCFQPKDHATHILA